VYRAPLTRESFDRRFGGEFAQYYQSQEVDTSRLLLIAFGLLDPGFNLAAALQSFQASLPLGTYDADTRTLFVSRDPPDSPLAQVTMAHEITHALQDQHYGLQALLPSSIRAQRPEGREIVPDQQTAIRALIEGDASIVQQMYQATTIQDAAQLARLEQEERANSAGIDLESVPYVVLQSTFFPYTYGSQFIFGVLGTEPLTTFGQYGPAVDALFRRPPVSTSQILHPEHYRNGVEPIPVEVGDLTRLLGDEWVPLGEGQVGELEHRIILDNFLRHIEPERAAQASGNWAGASSGVYRRRDATGEPLGDVALVLKTRWATPAAAATWASAYADTVPLRFGDPQRYAGRTHLLESYAPRPGRLSWLMPDERAIALAWAGLFSAIAIAPELDVAQELAERALAGP
jgi:hypothetical protein